MDNKQTKMPDLSKVFSGNKQTETENKIGNNFILLSNDDLKYLSTGYTLKEEEGTLFIFSCYTTQKFIDGFNNTLRKLGTKIIRILNYTSRVIVITNLRKDVFRNEISPIMKDVNNQLIKRMEKLSQYIHKKEEDEVEELPF